MRGTLFLLAWGFTGATVAAQAPAEAPRSLPVEGGTLLKRSGVGGQGSAKTQAAPPAAPQPAAATPGNVQSFDPQGLRLSWANRHWQLLTPSGETLKDFGPREQEARQALGIIRELGLNQHGTIGSPHALMEYWLADGRAPQGLPGGMRAVPLDPAGLKVEQVQGQWVLRDPRRILFNFGDRPNEARQALEVVQRYGFSQVGVIGHGVPSMLVFLARPSGPAGPLPATHGPGSGGSHLAVPHFPRNSRPPEVKKAPPGPAAELATFTGTVPTLAPPAPVPPLDGRSSRDATAWRTQPHFGPRPPVSPPVPTADRTPFDWRQVQLRQENADWKLKAGSVELASFGHNDTEARLALSALRHYRFTERWSMGEPAATFRYYLANGQAPRGLMLGVPSQAFQPDRLVVRQDAGRYALCEGERVIVRLGARPDDAQRLLEVIRRNGFDRLCEVGGSGGNEGMTFLVRSR
jgi:hypothetical protein